MLTGRVLGPYEILDKLGEGGMGEVYRGRDTRLGRDVAIKVLPESFSTDPLRRERLDREARAISSLDHPNICALYDVGSAEGIDYLVMQYLSGETLAQRLARGPLAVAETCHIGAQIADALAAAHRRGLVHRDLKPGNVMLTRDGVRLLDFGLAKGYAAASPDSGDNSMTRVSTPLTAERTIVGTLHYMAPEQLEGRDVDARTDIFALGAVLYEMTTGRRAFEGDSSATLIAAIMTGRRTPIATVSPSSPPGLARVIDRCLQTNPEDRWQSAADLAFELRSTTQPAAASAAPGRFAARLPWIVAAAGVLLAAITGVALIRRPAASAPAPEVRLAVVPPDGYAFANDVANIDPDFAVSPDGSRIAFVTEDKSGNRSLWIRPLSSVIPRQIPGTDGAARPFWSPDGRSLGYVSPAGLSVVAADGGAPALVASLDHVANVNASWGPGDRILFEGPSDAAAVDSLTHKGLFLVRAGEKIETVPRGAVPAAEQAQRYPVLLPDGRHFLYLSWTREPAERAIYVGSLDSDRRERLVQSGFRAGFVAPDRLVYVRDRTLVWQRFTVEPAALVGEPHPIADGIALEGIPGSATLTLSQSGVIAYRSRNRDLASELRWIDRQGRVAETLTEASDITVSLAPDGRRVALTRVIVQSGSDDRAPSNVWLFDLTRRIPSRLTLETSSTDENALWSRDGTQIAYANHQNNGLASVIVRRASGVGAAHVVASGPLNFHPIDWAVDGTLLLQAYATGAGADDVDLWTLEPGAGAKPKPLIAGPGSQSQGQFSPDGRWVAYASNESGREEVYVRPARGGDARWQISSDGGAQPRWRRDGGELFYVTAAGAVMAVPIAAGSDFSAGPPVALFTEPTLATNNNPFFYGGAAAYDVSADGQRFLVNRLTREPTSGPINLVLNWH